ncbi:uncharacterized protein [Palaemon carinicauda]|uniref:uncharacterized protein n=1 Tax=Palaemon carinicauda TaxID=392227 RepID=UPI0035B6451F
MQIRWSNFQTGLTQIPAQHQHHQCDGPTVQYADGNAAVAHTQAELQESVDNFHAAYTCFGLTVNKAKTKILAQSRPRKNLPSTSSKEIENRLPAGHTAYGTLSTRVFMYKDLTTRTKVMVYNAIIVSTLLYACETWTLYRRDLKKLEQFHQKELRAIMKIKWDNYVSNTAVIERANDTSIVAMIMKHRLR